MNNNNELKKRYRELQVEMMRLEAQFQNNIAFDTGHPVEHTIKGARELCSCGPNAGKCVVTYRVKKIKK